MNVIPCTASPTWIENVITPEPEGWVFGPGTDDHRCIGTTLTHSPGLVEAVFSPTERGRVLKVERAVSVDVDGDEFKPVRDVLRENCTLDGFTRHYEDAAWLGGLTEYTAYVVFDSCPRTDVEHDCRNN